MTSQLVSIQSLAISPMTSQVVSIQYLAISPLYPKRVKRRCRIRRTLILSTAMKFFSNKAASASTPTQACFKTPGGDQRRLAKHRLKSVDVTDAR